MKKFALLPIFLLSIITNAQEKQIIDAVLWVVGDEAILKSEVEEQRIMAQYNGSDLGGDANCVIPEQIAIQHLFLHQASLDSINASDGQVNTRVNMQINQYIAEIGSQEKLEEYFKKSMSEIREEMYDAIKKQMIVQEVQQKIVGNNKISPSEVRKFYNNLHEDSIPTMPATVEVQIIKIDPEIQVKERENVKNQLRKFADRVNKEGADFTMLARLYSEDDGTAQQGGDLGFFSKGMMEPEFSKVAFDLQEEGKVSRVVETIYGYHIIQLVEKKGDRIRCRHIMMRPKVSKENKKIAIDKLDSIAFIIKNNTMPFEQAAMLYSSDKDTRLNGGLMSNTNDGSTRFEYQSLPSEISKTVYNMEEGQVSMPFSMIDTRLGKEVFAIVKLKSKLSSHKANLNDDYQVIKSYCENLKKEEVLKNWIQNKIHNTYIYIDENYRDCNFTFEGWVK